MLVPQATSAANSTQDNLFFGENTYDIIKATGCEADPTPNIISSGIDAAAVMISGARIREGNGGDGSTGSAQPLNTSRLMREMCRVETGQTTIGAVQNMLQQPVPVDAPFALIDTLYNNPPASAIVYAQEMFDKVSHPGQAFAASPYFPGLGFNAYSAIRPIWGTLVNFVYSIMILLILVVAFGLMFQNFGGKATVQLSTAIPNIIAAMVLIPLSYPISAFAVDFLALGSNMVHGVLLSGPNAIGAEKYDGGKGVVKVEIKSGGQVFDKLIDALVPKGNVGYTEFNNERNRGFYIDDPRVSVLRAFTLIDVSGMTDFLKNFDSGVNQQFGNFLNQACPTGAPTNSIACTIQRFSFQISTFVNGTLGFQGVGSLISDIISLVLSYFLFFTGVILFLKLLVKYITMLTFPIFSPIFFASIALPGQGTSGIVFYLRSVYGSAIFFIVTYACILAIVLLSQDGIVIPQGAQLNDTNSFIPPLLGITNGNLLGGAIEAVSNPGIQVSLVSMLDSIALALFFALPKVLNALEDYLNLKFKLPEQLQYVTQGFQASRGLAGLTARGIGEAGRTALNLPRAALQNRVQYLDTTSPLGQQSYIEQQKSAAAGRARINAYQRESTNSLTRLRANLIGKPITDLRNRVTLAGTGIDVQSVVPQIARTLNWNFISDDIGPNQSQINIRKRSLRAGAKNYLGVIEFSISKEDGNRIYGEVMFTNADTTINKEANRIVLAEKNNPSIRAVMTVDTGGKVTDLNNGGKGVPNPVQKNFEIIFDAEPQPGQVFTPAGAPTNYSRWYRPTASSPQGEDQRALTIRVT